MKTETKFTILTWAALALGIFAMAVVGVSNDFRVELSEAQRFLMGAIAIPVALAAMGFSGYAKMRSEEG